MTPPVSADPESIAVLSVGARSAPSCRAASNWRSSSAESGKKTPPLGITGRSTPSSQVKRETGVAVPYDAGKTTFEPKAAALYAKWPAAFALNATRAPGLPRCKQLRGKSDSPTKDSKAP